MTIHAAICMWQSKTGIYQPPSVDKLYRSIECIFGVTKEQIQSKDRHKEVVEARQAFCYVARYKFIYSLKKIGKEIKKDHTSVIHSTETFENRLRENLWNIQDKYKRLLQEI